jgi:hypothetical protein
MIYLRQFNTISPIERIISAASYLTAGMAGFIWMIIGAVLKKQITPFLMYHILQSIFLSIAYFILVELSKLLFVILYKIPLINAIPYFINMPLPLFYNLSIIQVITTAVILYLAITSFMGMYSYFPYVSEIINSNTGRR